jgi:Ni/Fe-hydrogenase 1 B-type cytochrome subunit
VGNKYSDCRNFFILHKKEQLKEVKDVLRVDVFQATHKPLPSIGHNALGGFTYFITFLMFLFQSITGFGMYAAMSKSWFPRLFVWIVPLMGGDFAVRQWHHMFMWLFIVYSFIHVYLVFYHDYIEARGVTSSMVGGWKFIEKEQRIAAK